MSRTTWIVIGVVGVAVVVGIALFLVGQNAQAAAPVSSSDLPQGSGPSREAGIFSTIWAGVGQITGGVITAATTNDQSTEAP